jgi:hypothetical protein
VYNISGSHSSEDLDFSLPGYHYEVYEVVANVSEEHSASISQVEATYSQCHNPEQSNGTMKMACEAKHICYEL